MDFRDRIVRLDRVPASQIENAEWNYRRHPQSQKEALAGSISELGFFKPLDVYVTEAGTYKLIDGQARRDLIEVNVSPETLIPCNVTNLSEAEAKKALLIADPLSAMAEQDSAALESLMRDVQIADEALAAMVAGMAEEAGIIPPEETVNIVEDVPPEPPVVPVTRPGDLWTIQGANGMEHRLLCADCREPAAWERLLGGERASCVFTDPPYGVSQAKKNALLNANPSPTGGNVGGGRNTTDIVDDDLTPDELKANLLPAFTLLRERGMADDCTLFVTSPQGGELCMMMMMMMMEAGLPARHVLIWKKNQPTFSMGRLDYDYQHEPILMTWGRRHKRPMLGMHKTSIWEIDKPRASPDHPTTKPIELYVNAYLNNSDDGDVVLDIYCGSGTAFMAAEQTGRVARCMEIEARYCDVAISRFIARYGGDAIRHDGVNWSDLQPAESPT